LDAVLGSVNSETNISDGLGDATFAVRSSEVGISEYTATANNVSINDKVMVEFTPINPPSTNPNDYNYSVVSQSSNNSVQFGGESTLTLTIKNTGTATWYNSGSYPIRLATDRPMDRNSGFYVDDSNWLATNRIAMDQGTVLPGDLATFTFPIAGAPLPGTYPEYFRPVVDHLTWMSDQNIMWNINVTGTTYQYQWISQSDYPTLNAGETASLSLTIKNTGNTTWYGYGMFPIHLATDRPADRSSMIYHPYWISVNRVNVMNELTVAPGEYATFTFDIQAPATSGTYTEYFRPVAENLTWMNDAGIYWNVTVR
jgi:archaellum component FlaG (FlaF/FlaG flagellin family)